MSYVQACPAVVQASWPNQGGGVGQAPASVPPPSPPAAPTPPLPAIPPVAPPRSPASVPVVPTVGAVPPPPMFVPPVVPPSLPPVDVWWEVLPPHASKYPGAMTANVVTKGARG